MPEEGSKNEAEAPAIARPMKRIHSTPFARVRRWARSTFSKEQLIAGLKQFMWVAPLTLLIWIYAEREQQFTARGVRVAITVTSNNENFDVRLLEPSDGYITGDLTGPRVRVEEVRGEIGSRAGAVRYEVPPDLREGEHAIPVAAVVNRDSRLEGMSFAGSEPGRISIYIDPIDEVSLPVEVREDDKKLFDQVSFSPDRIKVRIPRKVKNRAITENGGKLVAFANLASISDKSPGRKNNIPDIRVVVAHASEDDGVKIEPQTVSVSLDVRQADATYTIPSIPVRFGGLKIDLDHLNVTLPSNQSTLFNVRVLGRPDVISQIQQKPDEMVEAWVTIDESDKNAGTKAKQVWFKLPEGVRIHPDDLKNAKIDVNVTERTGSI